MASKDIDGAYALFSPRAQRQATISDLQKISSGNNYIVFEGYQYISVAQIKVGSSVNTNPNAAQGTVATVSGTTSYAGGFQGTFNATLEKVNGNWMIYSIYTTVPPDKLQP